MRASDLLGPSGPFARALEAYEHRPVQMRMADAVEDVLADDGVLLVEAGTGTGKTLAYLVPALRSGRKVVVSTGTRTLQDQIMGHDLPLIERGLGRPMRAACVKGLANYLCLRRFGEFRASAEVGGGELTRQLAIVERWRRETRTGDRAELSDLAEDAAVWAHVASGSETRIGPRCDHHEACFVTAMRREAEAAELIVTNHHVFFADLATRGPRGGGVLPEYDAVIFDEAHRVEDVATQFFGVQVSSARVERLVRDAGRVLAAAKLEGDAESLLRQVSEAAGLFFRRLPSARGAETGRAALTPEHFAGELREALHRLDDALDAFASHVRRRADRSEAVAQVARRAQQIRDDLALVEEGGDARRIAWTQARGRAASVGASPVDVSELMREEVFYRVPSVVLTSATLAAGGDFAFVQRRLGIDFDVREEILPSPFDYPRQAALYVPPHLPDPRDGAYLEGAEREVDALVSVTGGGAFVLCTSYRVMRELAGRCGPRWGGTVLVQGEAPKGELLERFRAAGDAVLFATASFWEGVDVPGHALRLVILDKLPFDVPTDPLVRARCERMREDGEQPFMKYLVPSAALALKQGFGRLVRSRRDRGIVAILDSRIRRRGYGKVFLRSLPDARRCDTLEELRQFWEHAAPPEEGAA
ncbi:MAG: ATP-dependent DNA helicase [Myxococcota bacterium]